MSQVQSVTFPRSTFTTKKAMKWLKDHDMKPIKRVDRTTTRLRYRILEPDQFERFATKSISDDIQFTIGFPAESSKQAVNTGGILPPPVRSAARGGARGNTWLGHVKVYRDAHPGVSYKQALSDASATWKKSK